MEPTSPAPSTRKNTGLIVSLAFLSITALGGGAALIARPDGGLLGMSTGDLATSMFRDFRWPGMILFTLFGIGGGVALNGVRKHKPWAPRWAMFIGSALVAWIIVQVVMIERPSFLQPLLLSVGILITGLAARANGYTWKRRRTG